MAPASNICTLFHPNASSMNKILRIVLPAVLFMGLPVQAAELTPEAALSRALSSNRHGSSAPPSPLPGHWHGEMPK